MESKYTEAFVQAQRDRVRIEGEREQLSRSTIKVYRYWVGDYLRYVSGLLDNGARGSGLQDYLNYVSSNLSNASVHQALNAVNFYCTKVLRREMPDVEKPRKKNQQRAINSLTSEEIGLLFEDLSPIHWLQGALLFGSGLRVGEMTTLRLKDLDLAKGLVTVRSGKGDKDRITIFPSSIHREISVQIDEALRLWKLDQKQDIHPGLNPPSLARKVGRGLRENTGWAWLFPSRVHRGAQRWHATEESLRKALQKAARIAGIHKAVNPHILRHSFATEMMHAGTDIRSIQELLGHKNIQTTQRYLHALPAGHRGLISPMDRSPSKIVRLVVETDRSKQA